MAFSPVYHYKIATCGLFQIRFALQSENIFLNIPTKHCTACHDATCPCLVCSRKRLQIYSTVYLDNN